MSFTLDHRKFNTVLHLSVSLAVVGAAGLLLAAAPAAAPTPPASAPATQGVATAPARGGRGGGGGGGRGGAMTADDRAKIDKLPTWKPGVGDGDYVTAPPYAPAPEN